MIIYILTAFLLSVLCGAFFTPLILDFCKEKKLYDIPNERKVHKNATPRLGGVVFMPSMLFAFLIVMVLMNPAFTKVDVSFSLWSVYFLISLMIIYCTGIIDDMIGLNATVKFAAQIIAASMMPMAGLTINYLYGFCGIYEIPYYLSAPLTVFIMVFIMNSINLIDGIDGLAASLSFLALGGFLISFIREQMSLYCTLIAGLMGALIPFFYFNVFGRIDKNRKIFMGDSGSLTLGFILSFLFVKFASYNPNVMPFHFDGLIIPYTLLVVPMFDVVRVVMVRLRNHHPLFNADRNHIHHKLMRAGLNQHWTLATIVGISLIYIVMNLIAYKYISLTYIIVLDALVYMLCQRVINFFIRRRHLEVTAQ